MTYKEPLTITKILDIIDESSGNIDEFLSIINKFHLRFNDEGLSYPVTCVKFDAKRKEIELMCTTEKEEKHEDRYFMRRWEEEYYIFDSEIVSEKEVDEHIDYDDYSIFSESLAGEVIVNRLNIDDEFSSAVQLLMFKNGVHDLDELRDVLEICGKVFNNLNAKNKRFEVETDNFDVSIKDNLAKKYPFNITCESADDYEKIIDEAISVTVLLNQLWNQTRRFEHYSHEHKKESQILSEKLSNAEAQVVALEKIIKTIQYDYENAHGMDIRNTDWLTLK